MSKLSYLARVMSGVRLKKMNQMIDVVHDKCGQNKVKTFFDMCWCGARYGAGYYDYVMFGTPISPVSATRRSSTT